MQASRAFGVPKLPVPVTLCISSASAVGFVAPGFATAVSPGPRPSLALERSIALPERWVAGPRGGRAGRGRPWRLEGALGEFLLVRPGFGVGFGRLLLLLPRSRVPVAGEGAGMSALASVDRKEPLAVAPVCV